jgi:hypothetical protein
MLSNVQITAIPDPRIDMRQSVTKRWATLVGSGDIPFYVFPTQSYSNSNLSFDIRIANNNTCVIDRQSCLMTVPFRITLAGSGAGAGNIFNPDYEALRSDPLMKIINTISFIVNGTTISYQCSEISQVSALINQNSDNLQLIPMQPDYTQDYDDVIGSNMSPFAPRLDNSHEVSRRAYPITVVSNSTTAAVLDVNATMNLFDWSPFSRKFDAMGINLYPFQVQAVFNAGNGMARMWSRAPSHPQNLTSMDISIRSQPTITLFTPQLITPLPQTLTYDYDRINYYVTKYGSALAQSTSTPVTMTSQLIELQTCPERIYVFVRPSRQDVIATLASATQFTDTFASVLSHRYTFGMNTNLLANQTQADIFRMSKRNGLPDKLNYADFVGVSGVIGTDPLLMGSLLCLSPTLDFGGNHIAGKSEKIQFQAQLSFLPLNPNTTDYELGIIIVNDGMLINTNGQSVATTSVISDNSQISMSDIPFSHLNEFGGSKIGDFFKSAFNKVVKVAPQVVEFLKNTKAISNLASLHPYTRPLAPVISSFGFGEGGKIINNEAPYGDDGAGILAASTGAGKKKKSGGREISRSDLLALM